MQSHLRVKIKSLAAEAAIIRAEERRLIRYAPRSLHEYDPNPALVDGGPILDIHPKTKRKRIGMIRWLRDHQADPTTIAAAEGDYRALHHHRTIQVREAARAAQLAMALIRGVDYRRLEKTNKKPMPTGVISEIVRLVNRYDPSPDRARVLAAYRVADWFHNAGADRYAAIAKGIG